MLITAETKLLSLFGMPIEHSLSPIIHNTIIEKEELDNIVYLAFRVNNIKDAVQSIRALGILGANITIPYKETVIPFLDELTFEAREIGAVNTIINKDGYLIGDNTDGKGFIRSIKEDLGIFALNEIKALIIGAGGVAKAIATSLIKENINMLSIYDINEDKAGHLAEYSSKIVSIKDKELSSYIKLSNFIINATPCGMEDDRTPFDTNLLHKKHLVYDVVYNRETPLIKTAKKKRIKAQSGLMMLLYQAIISFKLWTGIHPKEKTIKAILENNLLQL